MQTLHHNHEVDFTVLRSFLTVIELGSVSAAAHALGYSQSGISRHLRRLDEFVGEPLFERGNRGMRLTARGMAVAPVARQVLVALDQLAGQHHRTGNGAPANGAPANGNGPPPRESEGRAVLDVGWDFIVPAERAR